MKTRAIIYWLTTSLTAFVFLSGGIADIVQPTAVKEGMALLGYPTYFATILGIWKVLGGAVVLAPRLPLIKEWAYAGMLFNLTGAAASHAAVGDPLGKIITPLVILLIVATSWALRPPTRTLIGRPLPPPPLAA
ncbi:MAG: DoxX family protein [Pirellulales bacterium]